MSDYTPADHIPWPYVDDAHALRIVKQDASPRELQLIRIAERYMKYPESGSYTDGWNDGWEDGKQKVLDDLQKRINKVYFKIDELLTEFHAELTLKSRNTK